MNVEEIEIFNKLYPEEDECPNCKKQCKCADLKERSEFIDYVKDGRLNWTLHALSPTFTYRCECGKNWVRSRFGRGDIREPYC